MTFTMLVPEFYHTQFYPFFSSFDYKIDEIYVGSHYLTLFLLFFYRYIYSLYIAAKFHVKTTPLFFTLMSRSYLHQAL